MHNGSSYLHSINKVNVGDTDTITQKNLNVLRRSEEIEVGRLRTVNRSVDE